MFKEIPQLSHIMPYTYAANSMKVGPRKCFSTNGTLRQFSHSLYDQDYQFAPNISNLQEDIHLVKYINKESQIRRNEFQQNKLVTWIQHSKLLATASKQMLKTVCNPSFLPHKPSLMKMLFLPYKGKPQNSKLWH